MKGLARLAIVKQVNCVFLVIKIVLVQQDVRFLEVDLVPDTIV